MQEPVFKKYHQKGSGLVIALGLTAVISVLLYFMQYPIQNQMVHFHQDLAKKRLQSISYKILGTIQNDSAWDKTLELNPSMSCLRGNTCPNLSSFLDLYSSDGSLILKSSSENLGFNLQGNICPPSSPFNKENKNLNCPFKIRLYWSPSCTQCQKQEAHIRSEIEISNYLTLSPKIFIDKLNVIRTRYAGTIDNTCSEMGGRFNQDLNRCEFPFQNRDCIRGQKLVGITDDTTEIFCLDTPAIKLNPCSFASKGFNFDGSFQCL
jgi:hypothetical protein